MSESEFWGLTLREYDALLTRLNYSQEWQNYQSALICSVLANINRDPKKSKVFKPSDFMASKAEVKQQKPEDMLNLVKTIDTAYQIMDGE